MSGWVNPQFAYRPDLYMLTVMHTGTTWLKKQLKEHGYEVALEHCSIENVANAPDAKPCTTWRDPYRTAASWGNRRHFRHEPHWEIQWDGYREWLKRDPLIFNFEGEPKQHGLELSFAPLNTHEDRFGLHKALDEGDWAHYWSIVPREKVQYALDRIPKELKVDLVGPDRI